MPRKRKAGSLQAFVPEKEINLGQLETLVGIGCTDAEIAGFFEISIGSLRYRRRTEPVAGAFRRGRAKARVHLRFRYFDGPRVVSQGWSFRKSIA